MKIFLSAVSGEFEECRKALASDLIAVGSEVVVQEHFQQHGRTLLEKLERCIADCDRVIALVGGSYGWEPPATAVPGLPRRSYTHWEYVFAQGERLEGPRQPPKDTFVYFASPAYRRAHPVEQPAEEAALQQDFIASIRSSGKDRGDFGSLEQLRANVLRDCSRLGPSTPAPELTREALALNERTRFFYSARRVPFVGRMKELEALEAFLDCDRRFAWWVLCGPAGAGKSRTALECCLQHDASWHGGWIANLEEFKEWGTWQPRAPTLLIVDDVAAKVESVRQMALKLSRRGDALAHPVRALLLDREASESWRERFFAAGSDRGSSGAERHILEASEYGEPLTLKGLADEDEVWEIFRFIIEDERGGSLPDRARTIAAFRKIDAQQRPLFASFAADAIAAGRNIDQWDQKELLASVLRTEMQTRWNPAGVTEQEKNLLAVATLADGLPLSVLKSVPEQGWLPRAREYSPERYRVLCGRPSEAVLNPLAPAVLGEFFVLEYLRPSSSIDERPSALVNFALAQPPADRQPAGRFGWKRGEESGRIVRLRQHLHFLARCTRDFPGHPTLPLLVGPAPDRGDNCYGWAIDVANVIDDLVQEPVNLELCDRLHDVLHEALFDQEQSALQVPRYRLAVAGMKLVLWSGERGRLDAARRRYELLRSLAAADPELARYQVAAGAFLAKALALDRRLNEAHALWRRVYDGWRALEGDGSSGPVYALAHGASVLIAESVRTERMEAARVAYQGLKRLVEHDVDDWSVPHFQSGAILTLARASLTAGRAREARDLYDDLRSLAERHSNRSPAIATGAVREDAEAADSEAVRPVVEVETGEAGSSFTWHYAAPRQSRLATAIAGLFDSMISEPLLGHKAFSATAAEDAPDPGPGLRQQAASLAIDLLRAYAENEEVDAAIQLQHHLRDLAAAHPGEHALPHLYGHGTYILWRLHLLQGQLGAAEAACDALFVLASAHREESDYARGFAAAAYGTIALLLETGQSDAAVRLVRRWGELLFGAAARAALGSLKGQDESDRFYEQLRRLQAEELRRGDPEDEASGQH